jgi:pimeloyl-ACP methyl ester carboxylesterase
VFVHEAGSGTPIVLLHGFGVDHRILLPLDPVIAAAGSWRRLYVDLPGATRSPAGSIDSAAGVAAAVIDELRRRVGDEPFAILGSSFGGMIARHVAHELREQVLGLATLAGVFVPEHDLRRVPEREVLVRDDPAADALGPDREDYRAMAVHESAASARAFAEHALPGLRGADQAALERIAQRYAIDPVPEEAHPRPFTQPSLHIAARQDHVVGYRDALERVEHYPRATFAVLDGAGHNVHLEVPLVCEALVVDWLRRMTTSPHAP